MDARELSEALASWAVVDLEHPRAAGDPVLPAHAPGLFYALHRRHEPGTGEARTSASGVIVAAEHSGTHLDALCHQAEALRLYGGIDVTPEVQTAWGVTRLAADSIPPIVARGVLLDVASAKGEVLPERHLVSREDLEQCEQLQRSTVGRGDVVLVRTGYGRYWSDPTRYERAAGMSAAGSQWLADRGVLAVGSDNLAWDVLGYVDETTGTTLPGHVILLVRAGIYIVENLALEDLAERQAFEFVFVCLPLKLRGATGSPVRPIALVPPA